MSFAKIKQLIIPFTSKKAVYFLLIIGVVVFANMLFNHFAYDDIKYIQNNTDIQIFDLAKILGPSLFNGTGQYRPIPALLYTLMYGMFYNFTFPYHLLQLLMHLTIGIMVFFLLKKFFPRVVAFGLAAIFLIHPMQVESVSYISSFDNLLFFFLGLIALFLNFAEELSWEKAAAIGFFLLLSFFTKETGFLFIPLLLWYTILFQRKNIWKVLTACVIAMGLYFGIRFGVAGIYFGRFNVIPIYQLTLPQRFMNMPAIFLYYVQTFFYPAKLAILQNWVIRSFSVRGVIVPLLWDICFFAVSSVVGLWSYRHSRKLFLLYLFFAGWLIIGMGLHIQLIPLDMTVADRWFYFPIVGLLGMLGVAATLVEKVIPKKRRRFFLAGATVLFAGSILALAVRTMVRNTNWSNEQTLLTHDIAISDDFSKEDMLAMDYLSAKKYHLAQVHMEKSVQLNPTVLNINNLGLIYQLEGKYQEAEKMYHRSLQFPVNSNSLFAYINLAYLETYQGNPNNAIILLTNTILRTYPDNATFWQLLAVAEYKAGNTKDAMSALQKAYSITPAQSFVDLYQYIQAGKSAKDLRLNNASFSDQIQ